VGFKTILERLSWRQHNSVLELIVLALRTHAIEGNAKLFSAFHDFNER
jgi:hypothetical protein